MTQDISAESKVRKWTSPARLSACFVTLAALASACSGPNTKSISNFGQSATKAAVILNDAGSVHKQLALERTVWGQACEYLEGKRTFELAKKPEGELLPVIKERAVFTKALLEYSKALVLADDPEGVKKLRIAAKGLASSLGKTAALAGAGGPAGVVAGPGLNLLVNGVVEFGELRRRREILEIASQVDDVLLSISQRITEDQDQIDTFLLRQLITWERAARCVLTRSRGSGAKSLDLYEKIDARKRIFIQRLTLVENSPRIYVSVVDAHNAMVESEQNFDAAVEVIDRSIADLRALAEALASI